jgi:hypothetical protein
MLPIIPTNVFSPNHSVKKSSRSWEFCSKKVRGEECNKGRRLKAKGSKNGQGVRNQDAW